MLYSRPREFLAVGADDSELAGVVEGFRVREVPAYEVVAVDVPLGHALIEPVRPLGEPEPAVDEPLEGLL
jgi:hypothetical protein